MNRQQIIQALSDHYRNKVRFLHLCDYVLFVLFSFFYLRGLQADVVSLTFVKVLHCPYFYLPTLTALVLTAVLVVVQVLTNRIFRLKGRRHALSFLPSFVLLTLFTALVPTITWQTFLPVVVGGLLFVILVSLRYRGFRTHDTFWTLLIPNLICFVASFGFVTLFSNTNDVFHYELNVQRQIYFQRNDRALEVGTKSLASSRLLLSLRAYVLSNEKKLGECLFEYPILPRDTDLFIHATDAPRLLLPLSSFEKEWGYIPTERTSYQLLSQAVKQSTPQLNPHIGDYWLCTLLLQKKLDEFAKWLPKFYDIEAAKKGAYLPKHYREALILYRTLFLHPRVVFPGNVQDVTNHSDFMEVYNQYADPVERSNRTRRLYGNTYWWYYYFH